MRRFLQVKKPTTNNIITGPKNTPHNFISWNVNGLSNRIRSGDFGMFSEWLMNRDILPDIISIQEVRFPANAPKGAKKGDLNVERKRELLNKTSIYIDEAKMIENALEKDPFNLYNKIYSLADWKYAGILVLVKKDLNILSIRFNLDWGITKGWIHHPEGRVIILEFIEFYFLTTYSCNNGSTKESFLRRRLWDSACIEFLLTINNANLPDQDIKRQKVVNEGQLVPWLSIPQPKPIIWIGDLNCAYKDHDLSHPKFFLNQNNDQEIEYIGQPGCTLAERNQFKRYMTDCNMIDTYRQLHNNDQPIDPNTGSPPIEGPYYTWRGTPGTTIPEAGKYYGKGMRIDYALVSNSLLEKVHISEIIGKGSNRVNFFGSDHSPIILELKKS